MPEVPEGPEPLLCLCGSVLCNSHEMFATDAFILVGHEQSHRGEDDYPEGRGEFTEDEDHSWEVELGRGFACADSSPVVV